LAALLFNGGSLARSSQRRLQNNRSMAEELGLGFGETASVEMLPEGDSSRPKARARLRARSYNVHWSLTCCLLLLPVLAGLTAYLLVCQIQAQEDCVPQVSKLTPSWGSKALLLAAAPLPALDRGQSSCYITCLPWTCKGKYRGEGWTGSIWFFSLFPGN
jgi:hypothetical protein